MTQLEADSPTITADTTSAHHHNTDTADVGNDNATQQNGTDTPLYTDEHIIIKQFTPADDLQPLRDVSRNSNTFAGIVLAIVLHWYSVFSVLAGVVMWTVLHTFYEDDFPFTINKLSVVGGMCTYIPYLYDTLEFYKTYQTNKLVYIVKASKPQQAKLVIRDTTTGAIIGVCAMTRLNTVTLQFNQIVLDSSNTQAVQSLCTFARQHAKKLGTYRVIIVSTNVDRVFNTVLTKQQYTLKRISKLTTAHIRLHYYDTIIDIPDTYKSNTTYYTDDQLVIRDFRPTDQPAVNRIFVRGMKDLCWPMTIIGFQHNKYIRYVCAAAAVLLAAQTFVFKQKWAAYLSLVYYNVGIVSVALLGITGILYHNYQYGLMEYVRLSLGLHGDHPLTDLQDTFLYYSTKPNATMFVAEIHGVGPVGMVSLDNRDDGVCELRRMSVLSNYRQHRIGQRLCDVFIEYARTHGYKQMKLGTSEAQIPAVRLYEKKGWKLVSSERWPNGVAGLNYIRPVVLENAQNTAGNKTAEDVESSKDK